MFDRIKRRHFVTLLGGAAAASAFRLPTVRAQQGVRVRRIGVLMVQAPSDSDGQARKSAFQQALQTLGWTDGRNVQFDYRWTAGNPERIRTEAAELAATSPDVILTSGAAAVGPLLQATRAVPIVFVLVADPVGAGFVDSLSRPGGNATGFTAVEYGFGGKQLELLKEFVPGLQRVAVIRDAAVSAGIGLLGAIQSAAPSLGVDVVPVGLRDPSEIERGLAAFARGANDGLIVTASALAFVHRDLIVALAVRHKLPGIYPARPFLAAGGLVSYSPDILDEYRAAAGYVDRILKGAKPADLPVQQPVKYDLTINLKTAKALGLDVPAQLLARADAVIE